MKNYRPGEFKTHVKRLAIPVLYIVNDKSTPVVCVSNFTFCDQSLKTAL